MAPGIRWVLNLEDRDTPTLCRVVTVFRFIPHGGSSSTHDYLLLLLNAIRARLSSWFSQDKSLFSRAQVSGVRRTISVRGEPHGLGMVYNPAIFPMSFPYSIRSSRPPKMAVVEHITGYLRHVYQSCASAFAYLKLIQKAAVRMYGLPLRSPLQLGPGRIPFLRRLITSRFRRSSSTVHTAIHSDTIEPDHLMIFSHGFKVNCNHEDEWCTTVSYVGEKLEIW